MNRWIGLCLLIQIAIVPVVWNLYRTGDFNDDATYVALARSLAQGLPYQDLFQLGAPAQVRFPPGYPLLLAPLQGLSHSLSVCRLHSCGLALAALLVFFFYARPLERSSVPWSALLLAANSFWVYSGTTVMSESAFLVALLLYLKRLEGMTDSKGRDLFVLGLAAALCYYLRAVGLMLVPTTLLWRWRQSWRGHAWFLLGFVVAAGPHALAKVFSGYDGEFAGQQSSLARIWLTNLGFVPTSYGAAVLGGPGWQVRPLFWLVFALALGGLWGLRKKSSALCWTACYLLAILSWPFYMTRFVLPILPFLVLGLSTCLRSSGGRNLLLAGVFLSECLGVLALHPPPQPSRELEVRQVAARIPLGKHVAADNLDLGLYLNIPSHGRPPREPVDREWDWFQSLLDNGVGLVVMRTSNPWPPREHFLRRPHLYRLVHESAHYRAFTFEPAPGVRRALLRHSCARQALAQQRWTGAEWLLRAALRDAPQDSAMHSGLAYSLAHQQRWAEARWEVRQALQRDDSNGEAIQLQDFLRQVP